MPPYDERIRDPNLVSTIADEGLSENLVSKILLECLRQMFLSSDNFATATMRNRQPSLIWSPDVALSRVRIVRDVDWAPQDEGRMPEIVIRLQGVQWQSPNVGGRMDAPYETVEDPEWLSQLVTGRCVVWAISSVPDEAKELAHEIGLFFSAFAPAITQEYGLEQLTVAAIGGVVHVAERKGCWGCPVALGYRWTITQQLIQQRPRIAEIISDTAS